MFFLIPIALLSIRLTFEAVPQIHGVNQIFNDIHESVGNLKLQSHH